MRKHNALNDLKFSLASAGICALDGRRFTDSLCTHATPEQIAATIAMDAEVYAAYNQKPARPVIYDQTPTPSDMPDIDMETVQEVPF